MKCTCTAGGKIYGKSANERRLSDIHTVSHFSQPASQSVSQLDTDASGGQTSPVY